MRGFWVRFPGGPPFLLKKETKGDKVKLTEAFEQSDKIRRSCWSEGRYIFMSADGWVREFMPDRSRTPIYKIKNDDFEEIWNNNKVLRELRDKDLLIKCNSCSYRYYCGGCRARAYGYIGDYLAPDPGCIRNKDIYESLIK